MQRTSKSSGTQQKDTPGPLPQDKEAERSILGAVLLDNGVLPQAAAVLAADDFLIDANRLIFRVMLDMAKAGMEIDTALLSGYLRDRKQLQIAGGVAYISTLAKEIPRTKNILSYCKRVLEKSVRRRIAFRLEAVQLEALNGNSDAGTIARSLADEMAKIAAVSSGTGFRFEELQTSEDVVAFIGSPHSAQRKIPRLCDLGEIAQGPQPINRPTNQASPARV